MFIVANLLPRKNFKIPAAYVVRVLMTIKKQFCVIRLTSGYTGNAMEQQLKSMKCIVKKMIIYPGCVFYVA